MKRNRLIPIAAIALLALGAASAFTYRVLAQPGAGQTTQSQDCAAQDDDATEVKGADTDAI